MTPLPILLAIKIILIITIRRRRKKGNNKEIANKEIATCFQATAQLERSSVSLMVFGRQDKSYSQA